MVRRSQVPDEAILHALIDAGGQYAPAAHSLGVSPRTLARWVDRNPELVQRSNETLGLQVMSALLKKAAEGNLSAIRLFLARFGMTPWESTTQYRRRLIEENKAREKERQEWWANCEIVVLKQGDPEWEELERQAVERRAQAADAERTRTHHF